MGESEVVVKLFGGVDISQANRAAVADVTDGGAPCRIGKPAKQNTRVLITVMFTPAAFNFRFFQTVSHVTIPAKNLVKAPVSSTHSRDASERPFP